MLLSKEEIKQCDSLNQLEGMQERVYRDCAEINDCSQCYHENEDDYCDLELITRRIGELTRGDNN